MNQLTKGQTIGIVALLAIVTGWVGVNALHFGQPAVTPGIIVREPTPAPTANPASPVHAPAEPVTSPAPIPAATAGTPPAEIPAADIVVHVAGAVKKPGVYHLKQGARNDDALKAAGGAVADANTDAINLAAHVEDGSQLYIPTHKEQPAGGASPTEPTPTKALAPGKATSTHTATKSGSGDHSGHTSNKLTSPAQGLVNLNTANAEQLQRIPGIGPAMADRILEYRKTTGKFQSPEDLLQISGIGAKKFEKMKPFVKVR